MCALLRYSAGGLAVLLATAYLAVSAETGIDAFRPSVFEPAPLAESVVNRTNKGDRELTIRDGHGPAAQNPAAGTPATTARENILEGCDPAFSPLMASAKNNFAGRCLAAVETPIKLALALPR
jgi:hypothetical protein